MPQLPALAHQVRSGALAVPTPQRIANGGHQGFAGNGRTVAIPDQIYGMILPRQGFPSPRAVAGASRADAIRLSGRRSRRRRGGRGGQRVLKPGCWVKGKYVVPCPTSSFAGKSHADAVRLASGSGVAGAMYPPGYPDYPGNARRRDTRRRPVAGGHHHGHGACCDSCAHGGPCEGCDGAGGCGKPNCACNQAIAGARKPRRVRKSKRRAGGRKIVKTRSGKVILCDSIQQSMQGELYCCPASGSDEPCLKI